jgi:hypothetical protein
MVFDIRQNSTLPDLQVKFVCQDYENFDKFQKRLEESQPYFSMVNVETNKYIVLNAPCEYKIVERKIESNYEFDIFIVFKWNNKLTKNIGYYKGEFLIKFKDNGEELRLPIRDELFINIKPSITNGISLIENC